MYVQYVSSPYLLVFGDDRVRGTREQMLLQMDLVRPRDGAGLVLGEDFMRTFIKFFLCFQINCNYKYSGLLDNYNLIYTYEFWFIKKVIRVYFNIPAFWEYQL